MVVYILRRRALFLMPYSSPFLRCPAHLAHQLTCPHYCCFRKPLECTESSLFEHLPLTFSCFVSFKAPIIVLTWAFLDHLASHTRHFHHHFRTVPPSQEMARSSQRSETQSGQRHQNGDSGHQSSASGHAAHGVCDTLVYTCDVC